MYTEEGGVGWVLAKECTVLSSFLELSRLFEISDGPGVKGCL